MDASVGKLPDLDSAPSGPSEPPLGSLRKGLGHRALLDGMNGTCIAPFPPFMEPTNATVFGDTEYSEVFQAPAQSAGTNLTVLSSDPSQIDAFVRPEYLSRFSQLGVPFTPSAMGYSNGTLFLAISNQVAMIDAVSGTPILAPLSSYTFNSQTTAFTSITKVESLPDGFLVSDRNVLIRFNTKGDVVSTLNLKFGTTNVNVKGLVVSGNNAYVLDDTNRINAVDLTSFTLSNSIFIGDTVRDLSLFNGFLVVGGASKVSFINTLDSRQRQSLSLPITVLTTDGHFLFGATSTQLYRFSQDDSGEFNVDLETVMDSAVCSAFTRLLCRNGLLQGVCSSGVFSINPETLEIRNMVPGTFSALAYDSRDCLFIGESGSLLSTLKGDKVLPDGSQSQYQVVASSVAPGVRTVSLSVNGVSTPFSLRSDQVPAIDWTLAQSISSLAISVNSSLSVISGQAGQLLSFSLPCSAFSDDQSLSLSGFSFLGPLSFSVRKSADNTSVIFETVVDPSVRDTLESETITYTDPFGVSVSRSFSLSIPDVAPQLKPGVTLPTQQNPLSIPIGATPGSGGFIALSPLFEGIAVRFEVMQTPVMRTTSGELVPLVTADASGNLNVFAYQGASGLHEIRVVPIDDKGLRGVPVSYWMNFKPHDLTFNPQVASVMSSSFPTLFIGDLNYILFSASSLVGSSDYSEISYNVTVTIRNSAGAVLSRYQVGESGPVSDSCLYQPLVRRDAVSEALFRGDISRFCEGNQVSFEIIACAVFEDGPVFSPVQYANGTVVLNSTGQPVLQALCSNLGTVLNSGSVTYSPPVITGGVPASIVVNASQRYEWDFPSVSGPSLSSGLETAQFSLSRLDGTPLTEGVEWGVDYSRRKLWIQVGPRGYLAQNQLRAPVGFVLTPYGDALGASRSGNPVPLTLVVENTLKILGVDSPLSPVPEDGNMTIDLRVTSPDPLIRASLTARQGYFGTRDRVGISYTGDSTSVNAWLASQRIDLEENALGDAGYDYYVEPIGIAVTGASYSGTVLAPIVGSPDGPVRRVVSLEPVALTNAKVAVTVIQMGMLFVDRDQLPTPLVPANLSAYALNEGGTLGVPLVVNARFLPGSTDGYEISVLTTPTGTEPLPPEFRLFIGAQDSQNLTAPRLVQKDFVNNNIVIPDTRLSPLEKFQKYGPPLFSASFAANLISLLSTSMIGHLWDKPTRRSLRAGLQPALAYFSQDGGDIRELQTLWSNLESELQGAHFGVSISINEETIPILEAARLFFGMVFSHLFDSQTGKLKTQDPLGSALYLEQGGKLLDILKNKIDTRAFSSTDSLGEQKLAYHVALVLRTFLLIDYLRQFMGLHLMDKDSFVDRYNGFLVNLRQKLAYFKSHPRSKEGVALEHVLSEIEFLISDRVTQGHPTLMVIAKRALASAAKTPFVPLLFIYYFYTLLSRPTATPSASLDFQILLSPYQILFNPQTLSSFMNRVSREKLLENRTRPGVLAKNAYFRFLIFGLLNAYDSSTPDFTINKSLLNLFFNGGKSRNGGTSLLGLSFFNALDDATGITLWPSFHKDSRLLGLSGDHRVSSFRWMVYELSKLYFIMKRATTLNDLSGPDRALYDEWVAYSHSLYIQPIETMSMVGAGVNSGPSLSIGRPRRSSAATLQLASSSRPHYFNGVPYNDTPVLSCMTPFSAGNISFCLASELPNVLFGSSTSEGSGGLVSRFTQSLEGQGVVTTSGRFYPFLESSAEAAFVRLLPIFPRNDIHRSALLPDVPPSPQVGATPLAVSTTGASSSTTAVSVAFPAQSRINPLFNLRQGAVGFLGIQMRTVPPPPLPPTPTRPLQAGQSVVNSLKVQKVSSSTRK